MILGIDLGSTVFKAEVFDTKLQSCGKGAAPVVYETTDKNRVEMPIPATEDAVRQAIATALKNADIATESLTAVAITSQAQTFTALAETGAPKWPAFISWRDTRCELRNSAAEKLANFADHSSVGTCLPGLTVAKLAYLREHADMPPIAATDRVLWLPTYFVEKWTGHSVIDNNLAAMSGLYSLQTGGWWNDALEICELRKSNLPQLVPLGAVAGYTTAAATTFGLPAGIPVVLAGNDQTAGAYGAGIHEQDAVLVTLGTAQVVYACRDQLPAPAPGLMRGPYPGDGFYQLGADNCGAGTVNWARTLLPGCVSEAEFDRAAASAPPDCHGVRFIADDSSGLGHWTGTENPIATIADQARAVLVCLTERLGNMLAKLSMDVGKHPVLLSGGGSESAPWRECLKQQLNLEFTRVGAASPPLGAAKMSLAKDLASQKIMND